MSTSDEIEKIGEDVQEDSNDEEEAASDEVLSVYGSAINQSFRSDNASTVSLQYSEQNWPRCLEVEEYQQSGYIDFSRTSSLASSSSRSQLQSSKVSRLSKFKRLIPRLPPSRAKFGGLYLQEEQISKHQIDSFTIFTEAEMKKATNKFDVERILGRGGSAIVYKGILQEDETTTTTTVAIKMFWVGKECNCKEGANAMLILSKINHVNVIKLLGCCLEVNPPMLVYEYISNGTLFEKIHCDEPEHRHMMSWDLRLRIGAQTAKALSYLHSEASPPIIHGDINSANILLDENFTAKVCDFGTSTFAPKDKSMFMTQVLETIGYMDPQYLYTGELTDKSDVYSFGVVMVELLTGKKPIYRDNENNEMNLVSQFLTCLKEGRLLEILDSHIKDDEMEQIELVADVVKQCLSFTREERPTMTYVSMVLTKPMFMKEYHRLSQLSVGMV